jgi:hypothetical protein
VRITANYRVRVTLTAPNRFALQAARLLGLTVRVHEQLGEGRPFLPAGTIRPGDPAGQAEHEVVLELSDDFRVQEEPAAKTLLGAPLPPGWRPHGNRPRRPGEFTTRPLA